MSRILVGVSGGIAAYKACELTRLFVKAGHEVIPLVTPGAERFVRAETFYALARRPPGEDLYAHLTRGDLLVVAPCSANTLAKLAHGLADNVVSEAALAHRGPVLLAPAMNPRMWAHPATRANIEALRARGAEVVGPDEGETAEGEWGVGRMAEPDEIYRRARELLGESLEPDDRTAEALGEAERAVGVPVGDEDRARALVGERAGRELAHLARPEDHHVAVAEVLQQAEREVHRDRWHAHAAGTDLRLGAHALARRQRGGEQTVGECPRGSLARGRLVRAPDLSLDLRLAHDHRVQPRGDAVQLPRGVAVARRVDRLRQLGGADARAPREQPEHVRLGAHRVADHQVDLGSVARGDHHRLAHLRGGRGLGCELPALLIAEGQALAQRDGRGLVGDAQRQQLAHGSCDSPVESGWRPAAARSRLESSPSSRWMWLRRTAMIAT